MSAKPAGPDERMVTLDVTLLGRDYKVACKPGEEAELREAVAFLDRRMRDIRESSSKAGSTERVAVMAALNLAHELQRARTPSAAGHAAAAPAALVDAAAARRRIASMRSAIEQVLVPGQEKLL